jgi:hypothetical protein
MRVAHVVDNLSPLTVGLWLVVANILIYLFIITFQRFIPFNAFQYTYSSHHYVIDPRIHDKPFALLPALAQYDANWYLKIAEQGYPYHPTNIDNTNKKVMDGLTYAFFPLYPLAISTINLFVKNVSLSALLLSNLLIFFGSSSLYSILQKQYSPQIALKTTGLVFFSPASIFYRSYFAEGLYLMLLIWFGYYLFQHKYILAAAILGILNITKLIGWLINGFFVLMLIQAYYQKKLSRVNVALSAMLSAIPFLVWLIFCYQQTGNPFYFYVIRSAWAAQGWLSIVHNTVVVFLFPLLPFHAFHLSLIDSVCIVFVAFVLLVSRKTLPLIWWGISFCLWLSPLLVTDTMSFLRYQIVSFPIALYFASALPTRYYMVVFCFSLVACLVVSVVFVNWYWIG